MGQLKLYGNSIDAGSTGDRQSPSAPTTPTAIAPIQIRKWVRNGKSPSAELANRLNEAANFAALYRSKELFSAFSMPIGDPVSTTLATKWRFACHLGPYSHAIAGIAALLNPYGSSATQAKATLKVYSDVTESTLVGSVDFYYGAGTSTGGFGWRQAKYPIQWIDGLTADTDYYCRWDLSGKPRLMAASVWDMTSLTQNYNGYLTQSLTMHTPILALDRSNVHTLLKNTWKRGGAKVLNYVVQPGSHDVGTDATETDQVSNTTTATTSTNILDRSSTTISSATPGWTIDLRNKDRRGSGGVVPCKMFVFGRGTAPASLEVVIKNSAGTTLATATTASTTNTWFSVAFNAPATLDKWDIQFRATAAGRVYLYGISVIEYEA